MTELQLDDTPVIRDPSLALAPLPDALVIAGQGKTQPIVRCPHSAA